MGLLFADGFDDGLHAFKWAWGAALVAGRTGNCMRMPTGNVYQSTRVFDAGETTVGFGFACRFGGLQSAQFCNISNAGLQGLVLQQTNTNALSISRGQQFAGVTTLGTTPNNSITPGVWHYIEVFAVMHASAGSVQIRIDGVTALNLTGIDTGAVTIDRLSFFVSFLTYVIDIDDLYLIDGSGTVNNTFLGDIAVHTLYPNGNGNYSQLVGSDGNQTDNYLLVDEEPPSGSDYVEGGVVGLKDTYTFTNVAPGTIKGVIVRPYAAKSDNGSRSARSVTRVGTSDYVGVDVPLSTSYAPITTMHEVNPATGIAWTVAEVNGAEFGLEVR